MTLVARMPFTYLEAIMGAIRGGHQFDHADASEWLARRGHFVEVLPAQEVLADEGGELLQVSSIPRACTSRRMSRMSR